MHKMDRETIDRVLEKLSSDEWWERSNAIKTLLSTDEKLYLPFLEKGLKNHENAVLRNASMEFYVALGERALPSLIRLMKDDDPEARIFAANLLGNIRNRGALPILVEGLRDPDVNVRLASTEALGKIGDADAVQPLSEVLQDEPWVAMAAITSLGDIGGGGALSVLYPCLEMDEYQGITFAAIEKAGDENAIVYLIPFVDRDELRELALKAVVNIADRVGARLKPDFFPRHIPLLLELQHSLDHELRKTAFIALSWADDERGLPYFMDALNDEELQEYAMNGLIAVGAKAVPEIINALKDPGRLQRSVLAKALSMMGEHAALFPFSEDDDPEVRVEVALALGEMPFPEKGEILLRMLNDPEDEVRLAATKMSQGLNRGI
jgi:HEAT repeat protein